MHLVDDNGIELTKEPFPEVVMQKNAIILKTSPTPFAMLASGE